MVLDMLYVIIGQRILDRVKEEIIEAMKNAGRVATGKTIDSLETEVNEDHAILYGASYIGILETGRGGYKGGPQGNPSMIDSIREWVSAKRPDLQGKEAESFAWAVKKTIDKEGYKGTPGLFTQILNQVNIDAIVDEEIGNASIDVVDYIMEPFEEINQ